MKKIVSVLLAFLLLFAVTACAGTGTTPVSQPSSGGSTEPTTEPGQTTTENEEPYEIIIELINYGMDIPDLPLIESAVNEIIMPKINSTIKFKTVPVSEQFMKLSLWVAGEEKVDLAMTGITTNPGNLVAQGCLLPITELIENSEILMDLGRDYLAACTINGEIYSFPGILYPASGASYLYNADVAAEYDIQVPNHVNTIADLEPIFEAVKNSGMDLFATSLGDGKNQTESILDKDIDAMNDPSYLTNGAIMLDEPANTIVNIFETQAYYDSVTRLRDWYNKGYVDTLSFSNGYSTHDSVTNGTAFGAVFGISAGSSVAYWSGTTGKNLAECTIGEKTINNGGVTSMSWGVAVTSERPEKAIEFLEIMMTDTAVANLLNYGIEDQHYVRVEGTEQIIQYPEGKNAFSNGYGTFINWYGDTEACWQMQPMTDDFFGQLDGYTPAGGALVVPSFGYTFNSADFSTELSTLTSVVDEYRSPLEVGIVEDVDSHLQAFIDALKAAGIDEVIAANQAQFDDWVKNK